MGDMLKNGLAWLAAQQTAHVSGNVIYQRGADQITVAAMAGDVRYEVTESDGLVTQYISRDFLIDSALLVIDAARILPARGDKIIETLNGVTHTYSVLPPPGGEHHYRPCDPARVKLRIHTKETAAV